MSENDRTIGWDELAVRSKSRNRTFMLPDVVTDRLDALIRLLDDEGVRITRAELVGALLYAARTDAANLESMVRAYRRATVAEVFLGEPEGSGLQLEPPHPGPRSRS